MSVKGTPIRDTRWREMHAHDRRTPVGDACLREMHAYERCMPTRDVCPRTVSAGLQVGIDSSVHDRRATVGVNNVITFDCDAVVDALEVGNVHRREGALSLGNWWSCIAFLGGNDG